MVTKKYLTIGFLLLTLLSTGVIYISLQGSDVKIRVDNDKSTFYVFEESRWRVSGREYNKLFDGTRRMNRDTSTISVNLSYDNITKETIIRRSTGFQRGPVIVDTYIFDGNVKDVEVFPVSHTVEIFNGSGFFYRYEVRDLVYDGISEKLSVTYLEFGRKMNVEWEGNYRWARVFKSGILKVQYNIPSDYEFYDVRLFDPIRTNINISKIKRCVTSFYNETKNVFGDCTVYWNITTCLNLSGRNTDCYTVEKNFTNNRCKIGEKNITINSTRCVSVGINIVSPDLNASLSTERFGGCSINRTEKCFICDSKIGGDGDGVCRSGELCIKMCLMGRTLKKFFRNSRDDFVEFDETFPLRYDTIG